MAIRKEDILAEIRKFVATHGESPGERRFITETRIKESAWKGKFWARWTDAVREAGYDPNALTQKIPDEDILKQLANFISELGHFPVRDEINMHARATPGFPVWQTVRKRYGGMPEMAAALLEFSQSTQNDGLARLCEARIALAKSKQSHQANGKHQAVEREIGCVYLKYSPSLRLYKIGRAKDAGKRGARISLLLPEDLIPKHEIKTDYPSILEKYWHNRFRAKRLSEKPAHTGWHCLTDAEKAARFVLCGVHGVRQAVARPLLGQPLSDDKASGLI